MMAVRYSQYGGPEVLAQVEVATPAPGPGEVLVKVEAASLNPVDGKVRRGELKLIAGSRFPKQPGLDLAGVVEALGPGVTDFKVGEAVFGGGKSMSEGTFAERIVVPVANIARRPASVEPTVAAGVPTVALAAFQSLRDTIRVKAGDRILVNGASGGVGLYAVQLAKRAGARVTAVSGPDGVDLLREFGAEVVVNYRERTVLEALRGQTFRGLLELSGKLGFDDAGALLEPGGIYVDFSPSPASLIGNTLANPFRSRQHRFAFTATRRAALEEVGRLLERGELKAAPTEVLPFEQARAVVERSERGSVVGKLVLRWG